MQKRFKWAKKFGPPFVEKGWEDCTLLKER